MRFERFGTKKRSRATSSVRELSHLVRGNPSAGPCCKEALQHCNSSPELEGLSESFPETFIGHGGTVQCILDGSASYPLDAMPSGKRVLCDPRLYLQVFRNINLPLKGLGFRVYPSLELQRRPSKSKAPRWCLYSPGYHGNHPPAIWQGSHRGGGPRPSKSLHDLQIRVQQVGGMGTFQIALQMALAGQEPLRRALGSGHISAKCEISSQIPTGRHDKKDQEPGGEEPPRIPLETRNV